MYNVLCTAASLSLISKGELNDGGNEDTVEASMATVSDFTRRKWTGSPIPKIWIDCYGMIKFRKFIDIRTTETLIFIRKKEN